ncbi:MAG: hydroxylase [Planctomycetota bacterium]|nr:MAG: hydroxylase [Planctomycetota bacterium]
MPPSPQNLHFLEIVTPEAEAVCAAYSDALGLVFSEPVPEFGMARTAPLPSGALLSVRAPMHEEEEPATRPYFLVEDIEAAVAAAVAAGGELALPPTEIPGRGRCAIYFLGGAQHGLWQESPEP